MNADGRNLRPSASIRGPELFAFGSDGSLSERHCLRLPAQDPSSPPSCPRPPPPNLSPMTPAELYDDHARKPRNLEAPSALGRLADRIKNGCQRKGRGVMPEGITDRKQSAPGCSEQSCQLANKVAKRSDWRTRNLPTSPSHACAALGAFDLRHGSHRARQKRSPARAPNRMRSHWTCAAHPSSRKVRRLLLAS